MDSGKTIFVFTTFVLLGAGCGKRGSFNDIPALAPLVQQALPSSLQISGTALFRTLDFKPQALGSSHLETLFKTGSYGKISGDNAKGYINSLLEDLDGRFAELQGRFEEAPACYSAASQEHEFDFSALGTTDASVTSMLKISLDLQCRDIFTQTAGDQSGSGSGILFGKKDSNYSLALLLNSQTETSSGFGYYAKVTEKGTDNETVNLIFAEARPTGSSTSPGGLSSLARILAKPKAKVYEMAIAASDASRGNPVGGGGENPSISCGFHAITNGTLVYAKGIDRSGSGPSTCSTGSGYTTELCLNATDLSAASGGVTDCDALKAAMTIGTSTEIEDWDYNDVEATDAGTLYEAMKINTDTILGKTAAVQ